MFTGIVQDIGIIRGVGRALGLVRLTIQTGLPVEAFEMGESIAVDGVCLTVVGLAERSFQVEVSPETLQRSTLGGARAGRRVNLERALRLNDLLGGHLVTGHIDAVGRIGRRAEGASHLELEIEVPAHLEKYIVEKGSVAVDGISLTINRCRAAGFELVLIPHTIERTTLAAKVAGDLVNIECDILGKYAEKLLRLAPSSGSDKPGGITEELLQKYGFF